MLEVQLDHMQCSQGGGGGRGEALHFLVPLPLLSPAAQPPPAPGCPQHPRVPGDHAACAGFAPLPVVSPTCAEMPDVRLMMTAHWLAEVAMQVM